MLEGILKCLNQKEQNKVMVTWIAKEYFWNFRRDFSPSWALNDRAYLL